MISTTDRQRDEIVHVIVLNWNGEEDTASCLDSLLAQSGVTLEILLIDNASPDGSGERLHARYPAMCYLQTGENLGYAGGNNRGIEWALARGAEWVMVVNNDTVADPECVKELLAAAASEPRLAAVAPLIVRYEDPGVVWFAGGLHDRVRAVGTHSHHGEPVHVATGSANGRVASWRPCSFLTGCCLFFRSSALREVGVFRADYFAYVEDLELSMRLSQADWRIGWAPSARLAHRVPPFGSPPTPMQIRLRDRNRRRLVREQYALHWKVLFALWFWPTRAAHLVRYAVFRDWARASAIVTGMTER